MAGAWLRARSTCFGGQANSLVTILGIGAVMRIALFALTFAAKRLLRLERSHVRCDRSGQIGDHPVAWPLLEDRAESNDALWSSGTGGNSGAQTRALSA